MLDNERCPYCGSENFNTNDYDETYENDEVSLYWRCDCNECKKVFHITKWYKLVETAIKTEEEYNEE